MDRISGLRGFECVHIDEYQPSVVERHSPAAHARPVATQLVAHGFLCWTEVFDDRAGTGPGARDTRAYDDLRAHSRLRGSIRRSGHNSNHAISGKNRPGKHGLSASDECGDSGGISLSCCSFHQKRLRPRRSAWAKRFSNRRNNGRSAQCELLARLIDELGIDHEVVARGLDALSRDEVAASPGAPVGEEAE